MIRKVKNSILRKYKQWKVIFNTSKNKRTKQSDLKRWSNQNALFASWDERTKLLANKIEPNKTVFEFGAARLALKEMLPEGSTYLHSDLVLRAEDTLVVDLNKELPVMPQVDYIVFSGVLEYLFDVEKVFLHLNTNTHCFLFSYATLDNFPNINKRRENGWVSDLCLRDIETLAVKLDKKLLHFDTWKSQHLFKLEN